MYIMRFMATLRAIYTSCSLLCLLCWAITRVDSSSLMKRIREKQNADEALLKGLDLSSDGWIQIPQPVQDVLMSIDDKLRSLDTFSYTLKLARLDFSLDQLVRRMENIETKLGRLETKFDVRMEKVEEVVISKDIKEEFSNEHLSRRMENLNEKINNKAAFLDAKLDIKMERITNKLELLERDLHNSAEDIIEKLIKNDERLITLGNAVLKKAENFDSLNNNVKEMRLFLREEFSDMVAKEFDRLNRKVDTIGDQIHNNTNKSERLLNELQSYVLEMSEHIRTRFQETNSKIDSNSETCYNEERLRSLTEKCENRGRGETQEQLDNLTTILQRALNIGEARFNELDSDVELYTRKVINNIQELWKTSDELKLDLSNSLEQGNKTRQLVRQEFRKLHEQIEPLPKLEPKLSHISEDLDKKVVELSATVDNSFATLLVAQNTFIASCRRIQEEELHIYDILQQIVYEMRNRSIADIHRISSDLQEQSHQINKSLAHVLATVLVVGNSTSNAVHYLLQQMKQSNKCLILTDEIDWRIVDSLCQRIPVAHAESTDIQGQDSYPQEYENIHLRMSSKGLHSKKHNDNIMINSTEKTERITEDLSPNFAPSEYDSEYQSAENDYK